MDITRKIEITVDNIESSEVVSVNSKLLACGYTIDITEQPLPGVYKLTASKIDSEFK